MQAIGILGLGTYLPPTVRTNDWWSHDIVASWQDRTAARLTRLEAPSAAMSAGARMTLEAMSAYAEDPFRGAVERRVVDEGMATSDMEARAARDAMNRAGIQPHDVDAILSQTILPERILPNTACITHARLGLSNGCLAIATESACNAFAHHVTLASALIRSGQARHVLSVHSSAMTRVLRPSEPDSAWWGDGAAAVIFGPVSEGKGVLSVSHHTDGSGSNAIVLGVPGQEWWSDGAITLHCPDREHTRRMLFSIADRARDLITKSVETAQIPVDSVDFYASHQGTAWLTNLTQKSAGLERAKSIVTFPVFGNISSVNIPLILSIAEREGMLRDGSTAVTFSGGAGETCSSVCLRWGR